MINHARTLLSNIGGAQYQPQYPGEEYISPQYVAQPLPTYLETARRLIFGAQPERVFLNYRVRELINIIHETEFADYVYALDPRVTYWPETVPTFFNLKKFVRATQIAGPRGAQLFFAGDITSDSANGVAFREYLVRVDQNDNTTITINYEGTKVADTQTAVTITDGLSSPAAIKGTDLTVRVGGTPISTANLLLETGSKLLVSAISDFRLESLIAADGATPITVFNGSAWRVETFAPPASATTVIPALEIIGETTLLEIFGVSNYDQPFATFKNLWFDHPLAAYRLVGFVLALIYRTEKVRNARYGG